MLSRTCAAFVICSFDFFGMHRNQEWLGELLRRALSLSGGPEEAKGELVSSTSSTITTSSKAITSKSGGGNNTGSGSKGGGGSSSNASNMWAQGLGGKKQGQSERQVASACAQLVGGMLCALLRCCDNAMRTNLGISLRER